MFADIDRSVAAGDLHVDSDDLEELIGRAPTPLRDVIAAAAGRVQG
jgi:NAD(P)H dehydrogenase (quinone)